MSSQTKIQEGTKQFALNVVTVGVQVSHVADLVQSSSSLLHVRQTNWRDKNRQEPASLTMEVFQHLRCTFCSRSDRLIVNVGVWNLTVRVWASRQLSSELSDDWRVQILHVRVEFSSHPFYVVSLQVYQQAENSVLQRCNRHDLDVSRVHHELQRHPCFLSASTECWTTRSSPGSFTRMRPSAAVVEDSVGSTSVSPSRNVLVSRSSPVTSNFTISFCKEPGLALFWSPLQRGRFICELMGRRAHTCSQQVSGFGFVFGQCVSKHQARRSSSPIRFKHPQMIAMSMAQRLSSIPVGAPGFVTKSSTLLQSMTLTAENRWMCVSLFSRQNGEEGEREEQNSGKHAHDPLQVSQSKALGSPASVDMHPCFTLCDFLKRGAHGAACPASMDGSVAPTMYPPCVRPVPS